MNATKAIDIAIEELESMKSAEQYLDSIDRGGEIEFNGESMPLWEYYSVAALRLLDIKFTLAHELEYV